jgi:GT2 family glycosyltransferase
MVQYDNLNMKPQTSSVIICTRNRIPDLLCMLVSLAKQTHMPDEVIIVDSSTTPATDNQDFKKIWEAQAFKVTNRIYLHTDPGLTYQRNQGVKAAQGDIIYFFDDDVVLTPDYLEKMQQAFQNKPTYLGGMGNVTNIAPYRPIVNLFRALFFCQRNYAHGNFTPSGMSTHALGNKKFATVEVLSGCCMAFKASVFKKHLFDEKLRFYGYMEDCDFSYRVSLDGPLFFNPNALLEHNESPLNRDKIVDNKAMFIANYTYLFYKNFYPQNRLKIIAYYWTILGLFLEAIFVVRNVQWVRGYIKGLSHAWRHRGTRPYVPE